MAARPKSLARLLFGRVGGRVTLEREPCLEIELSEFQTGGVDRKLILAQGCQKQLIKMVGSFAPHHFCIFLTPLDRPS